MFALAFTHFGGLTDRTDPQAREQKVTVLYIRRPEPEKSAPEPEPPAPMAQAPAVPLAPIPMPEVAPVVEPARPRRAASMAAPPAPTAEEQAFASTYKLKNSKGYCYTWGHQVRSMMGPAVEGPDQGMVRFRIQIASDGSLTQLASGLDRGGERT